MMKPIDILKLAIAVFIIAFSIAFLGPFFFLLIAAILFVWWLVV